MTIQEMVDAINSSETDFSLFWNLLRLTDQNNIDEAVCCIQKYFHCDRETAISVFNEYKRQIYFECKKVEREVISSLTPEQIAHNNAVARALQNSPTCPTCQSTNLKKISGLSKVGSIALWGVFAAGRTSKTWHCNNCGSEW